MNRNSAVPPGISQDTRSAITIDAAGRSQPAAELLDLMRLAATILVPWLDWLPDAPVGLAPLLGADPDLILDDVIAGMLRPAGRSPREPLAVMRQFATGAKIAHNVNHPRYFGHIPNGCDTVAAVGALLVRVWNLQTAVVELAPAFAAAERSVIAQLAALAGLPADAGGVLTSGGSTAIACALRAARQRHLRDHRDRGRIYISPHAHAAIRDAAQGCWFPPGSIVTIPTSDGVHPDPVALAHLIERDERAGYAPFFVFATAGTTGAGDVDPLDKLAQVAHAHGCWIHIDACVGMPFLLSRCRDLFVGMADADSISADVHKAGFWMPYATGVAIARDVDTLRAAHSQPCQPDYLRRPEWPWPDGTSLGPDLSRRAAGIEIKFPFEVHGMDWYARKTDERIDWARHAYRVLNACPEFHVPRRPALNTLVFGLAGADRRTNRKFIDRVNATGELEVSQADGLTHLCVGGLRTTESDVERGIEVCRQVARQMRQADHIATP